jgi:WD40 repeat protein
MGRTSDKNYLFLSMEQGC